MNDWATSWVKHWVQEWMNQSRNGIRTNGYKWMNANIHRQTNQRNTKEQTNKLASECLRDWLADWPNRWMIAWTGWWKTHRKKWLHQCKRERNLKQRKARMKQGMEDELLKSPITLTSKPSHQSQVCFRVGAWLNWNMNKWMHARMTERTCQPKKQQNG